MVSSAGAPRRRWVRTISRLSARAEGHFRSANFQFADVLDEVVSNIAPAQAGLGVGGFNVLFECPARTALGSDRTKICWPRFAS